VNILFSSVGDNTHPLLAEPEKLRLFLTFSIVALRMSGHALNVLNRGPLDEKVFPLKLFGNLNPSGRWVSAVQLLNMVLKVADVLEKLYAGTLTRLRQLSYMEEKAVPERVMPPVGVLTRGAYLRLEQLANRFCRPTVTARVMPSTSVSVKHELNRLVPTVQLGALM
jgi:hypothetical protein